MSSPTATAPALTTPFVPPPGCADQFITTSYTSWSSIIIPVLASGPVDSRFASCQPSGWNAGNASFHFSPAVCPSGWTAYALGGTVSYVEDPTTTSVTTFSTAHCCSRYFLTPSLLLPFRPPDVAPRSTRMAHLNPINSGFKLSDVVNLVVEGISPVACFQTIAADMQATATSAQDGLRVHNAWQISWASSDIASLSPPPPQLPCSTGIALASWVPGINPVPSANICRNYIEENPEHGPAVNGIGVWFAVVGVPIIIVALLVTWLVLWCRRRRRHEREQTLGSGSRAGDMAERPSDERRTGEQ